jgi:hypothetical protein
MFYGRCARKSGSLRERWAAAGVNRGLTGFGVVLQEEQETLRFVILANVGILREAQRLGF